MKNADLSAMPIPAQNMQQLGLTKRETFAMAAMQGLCHATDSDGTWSHDPDTVADAAVNYADALLAELEKTK